MSLVFSWKPLSDLPTGRADGVEVALHFLIGAAAPP
jgi:hypothetical protein